MPLHCFLCVYLGDVEVLRWYEEIERGDLRQVCSLGMWSDAQLNFHDDAFAHPGDILRAPSYLCLANGARVVRLD